VSTVDGELKMTDRQRYRRTDGQDDNNSTLFIASRGKNRHEKATSNKRSGCGKKLHRL